MGTDLLSADLFFVELLLEMRQAVVDLQLLWRASVKRYSSLYAHKAFDVVKTHTAPTAPRCTLPQKMAQRWPGSTRLVRRVSKKTVAYLL